MKIAIVTSAVFPPAEGIGTHIKGLAEGLTQRGHTVKVFIREKKYGGIESIVQNQVCYTIVPSSSIPIISSFIFRFRLSRLLNDKKIDVVHYHSPLVLPINKKNVLDAKVVTTIHSTMYFDTAYIEKLNAHAYLNRFMGKYISPLFEHSLIKHSKTIIAVSSEVSSEIYEQFGQKENVKIIPNAIDLTLFPFSNNTRSDTIVYVGRIGYRKGILELISAVKLLKKDFPQIKVLIVGKGDLSEIAERKVAQLDLCTNIQFKPYVSQESLGELIGTVKYLIMPSSYETGPRVVLEALACGTPVIATRVGLLKDFPKNSFIKIENNDPQCIKTAVASALRLGPGEYRNLQSKGSMLVNSYDISNNLDTLTKCYQNE